MNILVTAQSNHSRPIDNRPLVRVVTVGHVDHGKSTLIGRLLHETGCLPEGKIDVLKAVSSRRGMPFEWSFLLDALQTERDQGITLDTTQIRLRTSSRDVVLIDAPGHTEFLRNMITGAAQADAALLIVDATEGVRDQTRRHAYLLHLLGIHQIAVVINKMDRVCYSESRFQEIEADIASHLSRFGLTATAIIPISARDGDGVAQRTPSIAWHTGPTVLEVLERFLAAKPAADLALRMPVQAIYKFDDRRIIAGRVETGRVAVGDEVTIAPRGTTARVQSIEAWPVPNESQIPLSADAGQSVGLTLDKPVFLDRGDIISRSDAPKPVRRLRARVFWLHEMPLVPDTTVIVRIGMAECRGKVVLIENAVDPGELTASEAAVIARNSVGEIEIALSKAIAADVHAANPRTGRVVLELGGRIAGGGLVLAVDSEDGVGRGRKIAATGEPRALASPQSAAGESLSSRAERLRAVLQSLSPVERIARFRSEVGGRIVFTTSFGLEDQVILHLIAEQAVDIDIVTLDTGRLFPETYDVWAETERRYGRRIRAIHPNHENLENLIGKYGINGFYDSREARAACCQVRKVEPLNRALAEASGWIVGLRADQSSNRNDTDVVTLDERNLLKLSPLVDWTREAVHGFAVAHQVPINVLHAKSFASIGCAPCTRAIAAGEPERAGRWWWEEDNKKECGLHR